MGRMAVIHPHDVLLDNRAFVEVVGHVVGSGADKFDAALLGPTVRGSPDERRQERMVDVDQRTV
mgnify:CR=1 FL=1